MKTELCVIDTMVLRKANAPQDKARKEGRQICKRVELLRRIHQRELRVLLSRHLLREYQEQIQSPRNDLVRAFFEIAADPSRHSLNWPAWPGRLAELQALCRFPHHDTHVLRTAYRGGKQSTIFSEEENLVKTNKCIYLKFRVHIQSPVAD